MRTPGLARSASTGAAGFSIVELMVVLVILGLMATVVSLSWQAVLPRQQFFTAIRNLSEHLADTRSKAIAFSREFQIHYNLDEDWYAVRTPYRLDGTGVAISDEEERRWIHRTALGESKIDLLEVDVDDRDFHDGQVFVRFDPLGASSGHRIVLTHDLNGVLLTYTIDVLPLTGEIRVTEGVLPREIVEERDFD
ncbi:MAG: prepilin-type N-terminal cleavage/methylation domain-containing protein [Planctomycetota bacterium]